MAKLRKAKGLDRLDSARVKSLVLGNKPLTEPAFVFWLVISALANLMFLES